MTAELATNAELVTYSRAVGSAQSVSNGNYAFNSGTIDGADLSRSDEVTVKGTIVSSVEVNSRVYRSFRLKDLYTPRCTAEPGGLVAHPVQRRSRYILGLLGACGRFQHSPRRGRKHGRPRTPPADFSHPPQPSSFSGIMMC